MVYPLILLNRSQSYHKIKHIIENIINVQEYANQIISYLPLDLTSFELKLKNIPPEEVTFQIIKGGPYNGVPQILLTTRRAGDCFEVGV